MNSRLKRSLLVCIPLLFTTFSYGVWYKIISSSHRLTGQQLIRVYDAHADKQGMLIIRKQRYDLFNHLFALAARISGVKKVACIVEDPLYYYGNDPVVKKVLQYAIEDLKKQAQAQPSNRHCAMHSGLRGMVQHAIDCGFAACSVDFRQPTSAWNAGDPVSREQILFMYQFKLMQLRSYQDGDRLNNYYEQACKDFMANNAGILKMLYNPSVDLEQVKKVMSPAIGQELINAELLHALHYYRDYPVVIMAAGGEHQRAIREQLYHLGYEEEYAEGIESFLAGVDPTNINASLIKQIDAHSLNLEQFFNRAQEAAAKRAKEREAIAATAHLQAQAVPTTAAAAAADVAMVPAAPMVDPDPVAVFRNRMLAGLQQFGMVNRP